MQENVKLSELLKVRFPLGSISTRDKLIKIHIKMLYLEDLESLSEILKVRFRHSHSIKDIMIKRSGTGLTILILIE